MDRLYQSVQHFTSGAVGGAALVVAGQPFDTVKVKLQTFRHTFRGPLQCLLWTLKNEGILRGLYAGSVPSFFANMTENAVLFLFYEHCKSIVSMLCGGGNEVLQKAVAGAGAAGISTIFLCPFELLKCRLQAQQQLLNKASEMTGEPLRTKAYVVT
jgi:solute carrier family 25 ornithine transporter 2/15